MAADGKSREVVSSGRALYQRSYSIESQEYFECYDEYQPWHLEIIHSVPSSLAFHSANHKYEEEKSFVTRAAGAS